MAIKRKCSGTVIRRRAIINSVKNYTWTWLSFKTARLGWYELSRIAGRSVRNDYLVALTTLEILF